MMYDGLKLCNMVIKSKDSGDFLGGPVTMTASSQCRGPRSDPWSGNYIPHTSTESSHAATKDPADHNEDQRTHVPQLRQTQPNNNK